MSALDKRRVSDSVGPRPGRAAERSRYSAASQFTCRSCDCLSYGRATRRCGGEVMPVRTRLHVKRQTCTCTVLRAWDNAPSTAPSAACCTYWGRIRTACCTCVASCSHPVAAGRRRTALGSLVRSRCAAGRTAPADLRTPLALPCSATASCTTR